MYSNELKSSICCLQVEVITYRVDLGETLSVWHKSEIIL